MKRRNPAKIADATVRYLLLAAGTVVFTLPMIYMISTSLRPNGALYEYPPRFFPKWEALTLENYDYILHQSKFYLNFLNSVVVSLSTVALAAAVSSAMAFVLGKFKSRATQLLFGFIIVTMIIPGTVSYTHLDVYKRQLLGAPQKPLTSFAPLRVFLLPF